ncbi:MAG: FAD-dependent oxidoreductase [Clostridia bacterium]|nr:FAD-dependent oxidoreductase [Clostridia bacterium]
MKYVIVGGVAGGASAAARIRRLDEQAEIVVFERTGAVSYANCGMPYFIGGVIDDPEELLLQTPESFYERFRADVRVHTEVTAVDRAAHTVSVRELLSGKEYTESYDKLLLSPGAKPFVPPIPGADLPCVFGLRTMEDTFRIRDIVVAGNCKNAVVIGGGFVGLEMAENLKTAGLKVTLVEAMDQVMPPMDPEMAGMLAAELTANGIELLLSNSVKALKEDGDGCIAELSDGGSLRTDVVIMAVGVRPDSTLAKDAGLELNARGGIVVDEKMLTSDPDIYATGDAVEVRMRLTGKQGMLPLAGPANKQGRIAAANMAGGNEVFRGVIGSSVAKVFGLTAACTGMNEKQLKAEGTEYEKVYLSPSHHAGYYPGGLPLTMKLLFGKDGRVLGCQCVGEAGVDKRVDVVASVIMMNGTVDDLAELELCYAPPYSSAKDPVNYAGFIAQNVLSGRSPVMHWHDLKNFDFRNMTLLDVRTDEEYAEGHIKGSLNIPVDELRERIAEVPAGKDILVYCKVGLRGYLAQRILMQRTDAKVFNLSGGIRLLNVCGIPYDKEV